MNIKEKTDKFTDQGWEKLYTRLEEDGLLNEGNLSHANKDAAIIHEDFRESIELEKDIDLKWLGIVASFLICVSLIIASAIHFSGETTPQDLLTLYNEKGAPTLVTTMEDGSVIYLSEQGSIQYPKQFAETKREINLQGDAFFDISKNKEKPFFIETSLATIQVLGTAFDVKAGNNNTFSLSVKNGEVKVTLKKNSKTAYVKAGERIIIESDRLTTVKIKEDNQFDRYFEQIQFKDEKLSDIVRIINMNSDSVQLQLSPDISNRILTMTLTNDSPATVAQLICLALNLQYKQEKNIITIFK